MISKSEITKYRYKVNEPAKVKEYQSDINNFIGEFLGEDGSIQDAAGYHKAIYAAKNVDKIANHFYEQGRAEALKQQSAKEAKNIRYGSKIGYVCVGYDQEWYQSTCS